MATLQEHAYNIRNLLRNGLGTSDDDRLSIRNISFWIKGYRAKAIEVLTDYGKNIDQSLVQDLGVLELIEIDAAESCIPGIGWGCTVKKVKIPELLDLPKNRSLTFVGKIDKMTPIKIDDADTIQYKAATKFGHLFTRAYMIGDTNLYIMPNSEDEQIKYINVRGVFEEPEDVKIYDEDCNERCFNTETDNYPLPMSYYDFIVTNILQKEFGVILRTQNDELNNSRQDNETAIQDTRRPEAN